VATATVGGIGLQIRETHYLNANWNGQQLVPVINGAASSDRGSLLLAGESNGSMYGITIRDIARRHGMRSIICSVAAGNPMPGNELWRATSDVVRNERPHTVVLVMDWSNKLGTDVAKANSLRDALFDITQHVDHVVILTQPPMLPNGTSRETIRSTGITDVIEEASDAQRRRNSNDLLMSLADVPRVSVVDVEPVFKKSDGTIPLIGTNGKPIFHDRVHLSADGAARVDRLLDGLIVRRN
jgi:hypothetical protein